MPPRSTLSSTFDVAAETHSGADVIAAPCSVRPRYHPILRPTGRDDHLASIGVMPAERPAWAPQHIDLDRPNAARIYDYLLGGACNFEHDRKFAEKLLEILPAAETAARRNRAFLGRA